MSLSGKIILSARGRMKYTGARIEQYETLKILRRNMSREAYSAGLKDLDKRERVARASVAKREAAAIARETAAAAARAAAERAAEVAREVAAAAARVKRNEKERAKRLAKRAAATGLIQHIRFTRDSSYEPSNFRGLATRLMNETEARMVLITKGEVRREEVVLLEHRSSWENVYWRYIFKFLYDYSLAGGDFLPNYYLERDTEINHVSFVITTNNQVPAERLAQRFRDGVKHCVIDPLVSLWKNMGDSSESDSSRKRCYQIMRKIDSLRGEYAEGVPEEDMERVAKIACRKIVIADMFGKGFLEYNVKSTKTFSWRNNRENHVEVNRLYLEGAATKVSQEEFDALYAEAEEGWKGSKRDFLVEGSSEGVRCIRSDTGAWRVRDPLFDAFEEKTQSLGLKEYGLNAVKYSEVNAYIREACVVNSAPVLLSDGMATGHRDLTAAYTQHKMTSYFRGFLGKIQQWRKLNIGVGQSREFLAKHLGIFRCRIVSCENPLLSKLGLAEIVTLPSPELLYFLDHGVKAEIMSGVFGSTWDGDLYSGLMDPIGDVKKPYAHFAGCFGHESLKKTYKFHGDEAWAGHLKACGYETYYRDGWISVKIDKEFYYSHHHILAFITSYTRINMLETMSKFDVENLCAVVLDGIYYKGDCPEISSEFKTKPVKKLTGYGMGWYMPSIVSDSFMTEGDMFENHILAGQGGCGKTHGVATDNGFNSMLYVTPQHTLGIEIAKKYGIPYTTIHKLIGVESFDKVKGKMIKGRPWKEEHVMPAVCLIDEMTMIEAEWISRAIAMYPHTLFLIAGDVMRLKGSMVAFQCRTGKPGQFNKIFDGGLPIRYFTNDRRSQDNALKDMKMDIRAKMIEIYTDGEVADSRVLATWIKNQYGVQSMDFRNGDTVIAGTHKTNDLLLAAGIVSGYLSARKERSHEVVEGWKKRGSFTTHSYQGSTIQDGRVFVCINDAFELAMIYTAVSRAVLSSQIVFVEV